MEMTGHPIQDKITFLMHKSALYRMQSKWENFGRVLSTYQAGEGCNVIGPIRLHGYLPLQSFCIKVSRRESHKVDATSGGYVPGQVDPIGRPTTRYRWRAVSCYYMLYSYDIQHDILLDQPYYPVNHPRDVIPQMRRYFADMG